MTIRGRALFDKYVASQLNDPSLAGLPVGSHAFNLTSAVADARIPISEVIEEVGPLAEALTSAREAKR